MHFLIRSKIMQDDAAITPETLQVCLYSGSEKTPKSYKKIGEKEGSNPGGWYQKSDTDEVFYFKLYANADNARIEYLANRIYGKLGIRAATSELFLSGNDLWIASRKVGKARRASKEEQQNDSEFKTGFVADAYLCNWDVVGEHFDNVIRSDTGQLYRIDNGGCGPVRASGKPKDFSSNSVEELDDMRDPTFEAGQVFESVTEANMSTQTAHLLSLLDDKFLQDVYRDSGMSGNTGALLLDGLLGRREYLKKRFKI